LPPWRRWFARLSEKQEGQVRFLETALVLHRSRPRSGSSLDSKSERAGFNSLAACHALVAQLEEHRFRKPGVVGSSPTGGTSQHRGTVWVRSSIGRALGLHPSDPGSTPGGSTSRPCSSVDESARLRTVRPQVQFLPGALFHCGEGPDAPPGLIRQGHRVRLPAPQLLMHAEPAGDGVGPTHRFRWVRSPGRALSAGVAQLAEAPDRESGE
jgi:hypothetical protein